MRLTAVFVYLTVSAVWGGIYVPCSSNCTCWYDDNHFITVNCSARGFYSIPQDIALLDNEAFAEFSSLEKLDLSRNSLNILPPGVFRGLYSLESLNLQQNNLDLLPEKYPTTVFADLKRLKRLNIQGNYKPDISLSSLKPTLTNFVHLNNIDMRAIVNRTYPDIALSSLVSLSVLQMDALHYDILPGPGFRNLTNLTVLDFSKSMALTGLPELFFSNFSFQKPLQLILSRCRLNFIHPGSFAYLPTLHSLSLQDNTGLDFSGFEIASRGFLQTNVKKLDISRIHGYSLLRFQGKSFQNLKDLSLGELIVDNC
ncbi:leucine rich repeat-containing domain protein [Plakobranchus ocellatus]|uniref:Leucine rich repeat-containing domain protein n=1 Tax=Plakobranchus ocellatus TaxID=259542 RepID=A0AAV4BDT8_9GAST|nr:leucine rich repeat-containing domain protein [Plakobranchus ocellatus]